MIHFLLTNQYFNFAGSTCVVATYFIHSRLCCIEVYDYNKKMCASPALYQGERKAKVLQWYKCYLMSNRITRAVFGAILPENALTGLALGLSLMGIQRNITQNGIMLIKGISYWVGLRISAYLICKTFLDDPAHYRLRTYFHIFLGAFNDPKYGSTHWNGNPPPPNPILRTNYPMTHPLQKDSGS